MCTVYTNKFTFGQLKLRLGNEGEVSSLTGCYSVTTDAVAYRCKRRAHLNLSSTYWYICKIANHSILVM